MGVDRSRRDPPHHRPDPGSTRPAPRGHRLLAVHPGGLAELLGRVGMPARVAGYGNVLAGVAALWGLSVEDLSAQELDVNDPCSPLVAYAYAAKPA